MPKEIKPKVNSKKFFNVTAKRAGDKEREARDFKVYTSQRHIAKVAESTAKNIFYCDYVTIMNIN